MQSLRLGIHHLFNTGKRLATATFDHVGRQRPRATGKPNQRHRALELTANGAYRIHDIAQLLLWIGHPELLYIGQGAHWAFKTRTFSGFKVQPQAHRIRDSQNIRKQNCRIQRKTAQGLQGHFTGQLRIFAQGHKIPGFGAGRPILRQIAPRLAHHPNRCHVYRLAQQGT